MLLNNGELHDNTVYALVRGMRQQTGEAVWVEQLVAPACDPVVMASSPSATPFTLTGNRYDLNTFMGRFSHFLNIVDPRTLMASDQTIRDAKEELNLFKNGKSSRSDEELWRYRSLVESAIHPTTDEIIPAPFRMSAIAPVNIPIVWGMLACPPSNAGMTLLLHFINQSYNTGCNYFNRSGAEMSMKEIGIAYSLAVSSACTIAYGLGKLYERGPPALKRFGVFIPLLATAAANVSNIALTRSSEITNGVPILDAEGQVRGSSVTAGIYGVAQSAASRCVLVPASTLLLPTGIMAILRKMSLLPRNARLALFLELGIIYGALQAALPATLAIFPQTLELPVKDLEPKFQSLVDSKGQPITIFYANKGL